MRGGSWSAERIDLLKRLWSEGQSAGAIGERGRGRHVTLRGAGQGVSAPPLACKSTGEPARVGKTARDRRRHPQ